MPVRIFLADDHDIVREGVKALLKNRPEWTICGEASDGIQAESTGGRAKLQHRDPRHQHAGEERP